MYNGPSRGKSTRRNSFAPPLICRVIVGMGTLIHVVQYREFRDSFIECWFTRIHTKET